MPNIYEVIADQRDQLMRRQGTMLNELQVGYSQALDQLERESVRILAQDTVPAIVRQAQLVALVDSIQQQMQALDVMSTRRIMMEQQRAIIQSNPNVIEMMQSYGIGSRVNAEAVTRLAAGAVQGAPIQQLLASNSADAGERAKQILLIGTIKGDNPLKIASELRGAMQTTQYGTERIARTEVMRAYRGAVQDRLQDQGFTGGVWVCSPDACAYCWAMSGTVYQTEAEMDTHPNCRCSWAPSIGADNVIPPGEEAFAALSDAKQLSILGPGKFAAYSSGQITLNDLAGHAVNPIWGKVGYEKSLAEALG